MAKFTVKQYAVVEVEIEADTVAQAFEKYAELDICGELYAQHRDTKEKIKTTCDMSDCLPTDVYDENGMWAGEYLF